MSPGDIVRSRDDVRMLVVELLDTDRALVLVHGRGMPSLVVLPLAALDVVAPDDPGEALRMALRALADTHPPF